MWNNKISKTKEMPLTDFLLCHGPTRVSTLHLSSVVQFSLDQYSLFLFSSGHNQLCFPYVHFHLHYICVVAQKTEDKKEKPLMLHSKKNLYFEKQLTFSKLICSFKRHKFNQTTEKCDLMSLNVINYMYRIMPHI